MNAAAEAAGLHSLSSPAAAGSYLYGLLAECFAYPAADLVDAIRNGDVARRLVEPCRTLDATLLDGLDLGSLSDSGAHLESLAVEYTRLFDAGSSGTLCPLNGGLHLGPQMKVMEEAMRFYGHFGLTLTERQKQLPDHLTTELNFLHFLAFAEHVRHARGESTVSYRLARRDFIARHPGRWVPVMLAKLRAARALPLFLSWTEVLTRVLTWDLARLEAHHGKASLQPSGRLPFGGA